MMANIGLWNLERRGQELYWDGCNLVELAREYGTPLYVVNAALMEQSYNTLLGAFRGEGLDTRLFFSYKTNPVPDVLRSIIALGCGAEIISEFEFWLATKLGVRGCDMVVNGSVKSAALLREAVLHDVAAVNVVSVEELCLVRTIAAELGKSVNVGLRINPCLAKSPFDFTLSTGSRASHIGFTPRSLTWEEALRILRDDSWLRLKGLHFHIGSGVRASRPYQAALHTALEMWTELHEEGFRPTMLDIGGGFSTPTLKEFNLLEAICFFGWGRPPKQAARPSQDKLLKEIARAYSTVLQGFVRKHGIAMPTLYVEPGRALVASSQLLLLKVVAMRRRKNGTHVAVCDAGALSLSPLMLSEHHCVLVSNKADGRRTAKYDLLGNLPAPLDLVALRRTLPVLEAGDIIAVMDTGAYFTSLGNNFAGARPAIVMIEKDAARLARRREAFEDLVSRDVSMPFGQKQHEEDPQ